MRCSSASVAFGHGGHFCLGAALAMEEMRIVVGEIRSGEALDLDLAAGGGKRGSHRWRDPPHTPWVRSCRATH